MIKSLIDTSLFAGIDDIMKRGSPGAAPRSPESSTEPFIDYPTSQDHMQFNELFSIELVWYNG